MARSYGVAHPSPNHIAPFSNSLNGGTDNNPHDITAPNLDNDMHDGTVAQGDAWLQTNLAAYAQWALAHNSLLVVTFDEPDPAAPTATTPIYTVFYGAGVTQTVSWIAVNHYSLMRLLDDIYGLPYLGEEVQAQRILGIWDL